METLIFEHFTEWLDAVSARGLEVASMKTVAEVRATLHGRGVTVAPVRWATLIAYDAGVVLKVRVHDYEPELVRSLAERGIVPRITRDHIV